MIRGRPERITNLYVDGKYHKRGVGRLLLNKFEAEAKKLKSKEIKTRASLYAAPFYEKMGYKKTTGVRNFRGLKIWPMKKIIN
jgi:GNAT superfamily N-acetyltransferase